MENNKFTRLSDNDLGKVSGGVSYSIDGSTINITLADEEDAFDALAGISFPLGLRLDAASESLLMNTIAPTMGSKGPRNLAVQFAIKYPNIHIDNYSFS